MNEKIARVGSLIVTITVAVFAVLIVIVYFAQITTVRLELSYIHFGDKHRGEN